MKTYKKMLSAPQYWAIGFIKDKYPSAQKKEKDILALETSLRKS